MPAMRARYANFGGRIVGESRSGTQSSYVRDTLGSASAIWNSLQSATDTWQYWPWGEIAARSGSSPTPFQLIGTVGYYTDSASNRLYVRFRSYLPAPASWLQADPLWPTMAAYIYAAGSPTQLADPLGLAVCSNPCLDNNDGPGAGGCIAAFCSAKASWDTLKGLADWPDCLKDVVQRILKEIKNRKDNFSPSDCCSTAHGHGGTPTSLDDAIAAAIGMLCNLAKAKCPSPGSCASRFPDDANACMSCCGQLFVPDSAGYHICRDLC